MVTNIGDVRLRYLFGPQGRGPPPYPHPALPRAGRWLCSPLAASAWAMTIVAADHR